MSDFTTLMLSPKMADLHKLADTLSNIDRGILANALLAAYQAGFVDGSK
jgi:hypothetical protein